MRATWKFAAIAALGCGAALARSPSASAPAPQDTSTTQSTQPAQPDRTPSSESAPAPPPDSTTLEPIKTVKPFYPLEASKKKLQGQVWVKIIVSEMGDVESVELISGDPILA